MVAGLDAVGFGVLGVPLPPNTAELERHAGVLESAAASQGSLGEHGARAYRLGKGNAGAAEDALGEYVMGRAGVLPRSTTHAHHVSVAASVARVASTTVTWAGGLLAGLAGLAGIASLTPQGRALLWPRLRPFAQRVQGWIRTAMHAVGRLFTRLADLLRGMTAKGRVGKQLAAEQRLMSEQGRRIVAMRTKLTHARISVDRAVESMDRAEARLRSAESHLLNAKKTVNARVDAAYARGEIDDATRAQLKAGDHGWANHPQLDDMTRWHLSRQAERVEQVERQLGRHTAPHLNDAQRRVNEGLDIARTNRLDASDLDSLQDKLSELATRRLELADQAWTTRLDLRGNYEIQHLYPI
ncbi:hypothetical protein ABT294_04215 [Nonomuraea sp. NPDC000554]|uniref:hypothetical protein n=1 Tax=Nonomuraea sp. NPDC000554 TaxID=3154259 RepID=UPI00332E3871